MKEVIKHILLAVIILLVILLGYSAICLFVESFDWLSAYIGGFGSTLVYMLAFGLIFHLISKI